MKEEISRYRTHAKWSWGRHWCEMNEQKYQHNVEAIGLWEGIERKSKLYLKIIAMIIILNGFTNHPIPSNATNHPIPSNATTTWLLRLQLQDNDTNDALSAFTSARPPILKVFRKKDVELVLAGPSTMAGRTVKCYLTSESDKNCGRESCSRRLFIAFHSASYTVSPSWIYPLCRGVSKFNPLRHHRPRSVNHRWACRESGTCSFQRWCACKCSTKSDEDVLCHGDRYDGSKHWPIWFPFCIFPRNRLEGGTSSPLPIQ